MKRIFAGWIAALFLALPAWAQTYPDHESITVNDFAGLLSASVETGISAELDKLRAETGIEMTVVTLTRKDMFAPDQTLEEFAAGLFDQWGIGSRSRNDGILFLVLHGDRETRIELGKGYNNEWNRQARAVLDREVLPEFRQGNYESGISAGVRDIIAQIAEPYNAGAEPPGGSGVSGWWAALLVLPFGLAILWQKLKAKFARCPQCGRRGLDIRKRTIDPASYSQQGKGEKTVDCPSCGYHSVSTYFISQKSRDRSSSSGGSFGGGSSGGGGASGRW